MLKPSEYCRKKGLASLVELSKVTGLSQQTLINWYAGDKRVAFEILVDGVVSRHKAA